VKTVALKNPGTGEFTMMQLTGFGSISADDRSQYTRDSDFTNYQVTASDTFGTKVSLGNIKSSVSLHDTRLDTLEDTSVGIVDGGRAGIIHVEANSIDGGSASI
jgi:hypothetical protein